MLVTTNIPQKSKTLSLEEWLSNPPERQEWVNGKLIEKQGMTGQWIIVITQEQRNLFTLGDTAETKVVLPGFTVGELDFLPDVTIDPRFS